MKKYLYLILANLLGISLSGYCQAPCVTCFGQSPATVTITDPVRYNEMVPCSAGTGIPTYQQFYQRNRFKWYENTPGGDWEFKIKDVANIDGNYIVKPVTSPFVAAAAGGSALYLNNLLKDDFLPDNLPADGWELIRQDFGFANYNNTGTSDGPDNLTSTNEVFVSQIKACNQTPLNQMCARQSNQTDVSYIVLYNKYSATLRVLGYLTTALENNQFVYVRIQIPDITGSNANGLFALYDSPFRYPDQDTRVATVGVFARNLPENFFFADFQLAYDPCLCLFNSQMNFSFLTGTESNLAGVGVFAGDNPKTLDLITGMWDKELTNTLYDAQSNIFGYQSADAMADQLNELVDAMAGMDPNKKTKWKEGVTFLKNSLKVGSSLAKKKRPELAVALDITGYLVDYGSFLNETKPKVKPSTLAIAGTVTTLGSTALAPLMMRTPGSKDAGSVPLEFPIQNLTQTYSPIYNNAPGIVSILSQPKVKYYQKFRPDYCNNWIFPGDEDGLKYMGYLFDQSSLNYVINPILDVKSVDVFGSLSFDHYNFTNTAGLPNYFNTEEIELQVLNNVDRVILYTTRKSPLLPISCLGNIPLMVKNEQISLSCFRISQGITGMQETVIQKPYLHLSFIIELNSLNSKGENVVTVQTFRLPLSVIDKAGNTIWDNEFQPILVTNNNVYAQGGIPFDINIANKTFNLTPGFVTYNDVFAHETINFSGNILNLQRNSSVHHPVNFIAGNEITLNPGTTINYSSSSGTIGDVTFSIGSPYTNSCQPILPTPASSLSGYCDELNGAYKGKTFAPRLAVSNEMVSTPINPISTSLGYPIPNPANTTCRLPLNLAEPGKITAYISNAMGMRMGMVLEGKAMPVGEHNIHIPTESLEPGVYYITVQHEGFKQARRFVVVR